jgi:hypothetical protein
MTYLRIAPMRAVTMSCEQHHGITGTRHISGLHDGHCKSDLQFTTLRLFGISFTKLRNLSRNTLSNDKRRRSSVVSA